MGLSLGSKITNHLDRSYSIEGFPTTISKSTPPIFINFLDLILLNFQRKNNSIYNIGNLRTIGLKHLGTT